MNSFVKETIKNALILCAITLVAGLLLGGVYEITKEPRAKQQEITKTNAYKEVIKEASSFEEVALDDKAVSEMLKANDITEKEAVVDGCVKALDKDGNTIGYIVSTTSKEGYGGNISISVGFDMNGNVTGVSILSISETAGLGMEAKNESFLDQYKTEGSLYIVGKADNENGVNIDALSGATITTKAVTKAVNAAKLTDMYIMENTENIGSEDTYDENSSTNNNSAENNNAANDDENSENGDSENNSGEKTDLDGNEAADTTEGGEADE